LSYNIENIDPVDKLCLALYDLIQHV